MDHFFDSIHGWWWGPDHQWYNDSVDRTPDGGHMVEVGCFKGRSTAQLVVNVINSGKNIRVDCVDNWLGSEEHRAGGLAEDVDAVNGTLFEAFTANMSPVAGYYNVVRMDSVAAAATYEDNTLDWVFIDASHDYDSVVADINAWLPKVKSGGIISGHDWFHPPVCQAVTDTLGTVSYLMDRVWYQTKE
jgi:hypothetical protein